MKPTEHHDRGGNLAAPASGTIYEGRVARIHPPGDPLRYEHGRTEYRDEKGLAEIQAQLAGLNVTLGHLGPVVGRVLTSRIDDEHAVAMMLLTDNRAVVAIQRGLRELSLGYNAHTDAKGFQRGIKLFELSLVEKARCGPSCALRADCTACGGTKARTTKDFDERVAEIEASDSYLDHSDDLVIALLKEACLNFDALGEMPTKGQLDGMRSYLIRNDGRDPAQRHPPSRLGYEAFVCTKFMAVYRAERLRN